MVVKQLVGISRTLGSSRYGFRLCKVLGFGSIDGLLVVAFDETVGISSSYSCFEL